MDDVAETLRRLRREAALTQAELARSAGIPASVLSAYENGRRAPSASTFLRIVRSAGYEPRFDEILDDERQAQRLAAVLDLADVMPQGRSVEPRIQWRTS